MARRKPLTELALQAIRGDPPELEMPWKEDQQIPLWRLDDEEDTLLRCRSLAIADDGLFLLRLTSEPNGTELSLGRARAALTELAGPSSAAFDDYKQSFRFPFLLGTPPDRPHADYRLVVQDVRGSIYYSMSRVAPADDPRIKRHLLHPPFDEEFSRQELNVLAATFHGFLKGYSKTVDPRHSQPFVATVDSQFIVYGCVDGAFFEESHEEQDAYRAACGKWRDACRRQTATRAD